MQPMRTNRAMILAASTIACILGAGSAMAQVPSLENEPHGEPPQGFYAAIWRADAPPARLQWSDHPNGLVSPHGFRLADIEVWLAEGEPRYLGVFRPATGAEPTLLAPLDEADFEQGRARMRAAGRCLLGFEMWRQDGATAYAGVFEPRAFDAGCGDEWFESGLSVVQFNARLLAYGTSHHLVDFETVLEDDLLRISALWRRGAEAQLTYALLGVDYTTFHERIHDLTAEGYSLVDLDIEFEPLIRRDDDPGAGRDELSAVFSGVWRAGGGTDWLGIDYDRDRLACVHAALRKGLAKDLPAGGGDPHEPADCDDEEHDTVGRVPRSLTLQLVTIEAHPRSVGHRSEDHPLKSHLGTLHDGGTAGPP